MNSSASLSVKEENSALSGSRQLLLASDSIDFFPSENKIQSISESKNNFTTIIARKTSAFLNQQINANYNNINKNSFKSLYVTANGNKENPVLNGKKEMTVISFDNEKTIVNGNKNNLIVNGNIGNPIIFEKTEKVIVDKNKEKLIYNKDRTLEDGIPIPNILLYTGSIHMQWKQIHKIGAGLCNVGNSCFLNTVVQCLTYCPPLANYLLYDNDHTSKCTITGFCMMCILKRHMKRAMAKSGDIIKPDEVYNRLRSIAKHFQPGRQEDAHEFLRYVIDNLWKSCLSQNNGYLKLDPATKETTVINQIFGGYHRSQVTCLRCKGKSNTYDHFMDFILDIKQNVFSLEKALEKFNQPELLEQENSYKCQKCKMKVTAQKRFTVYKAPNVATFQLKRFDYNRSFGGKITKHITYPLKLNLRPYMSDSKGEPVYYQLNAVLVHSGPHCNSGHYYCYVKNSNGSWYVMDDQRVHQVNEGQVLNQIAYVLFYIKISSTPEYSFKKFFEEKSFCKKENVSSGNFQTISSVKLSPLTENNYPTVKRKEKILLSDEKMSWSELNGNPPVPCLEDPSVSSNGNRKIIHSKTVCSSEPLTKPVETNRLDSKKCPSWNKFSNFNIKRKLSNSALKVSSLNSNNSTSKVIATSVWTVTDAQDKSPNSKLGTDSSNVNSISDWQITTADMPSLTKQKLKTGISNCESAPSFSNGYLHSPVNQKTEKPDIPSEPSFQTNSVKNPSFGKVCNFHKHETDNCQDFRGEGENNQKNSSIKRKCCDNDPVSSENSEFHKNQNQHSPLPKKIKYTLNARNNDSNDSTHIPKLSLDNIKGSSPMKESPLENSPFKKQLSKKNHLGEINIFSSNQSVKVNGVHSRCSSSNSSTEYEWVEKTKDNMEYKHPSAKRLNNYSSEKHYQNCNSKKEKNQSSNVVRELTKNSGNFYGSLVPMWKRFERDIVNYDHKRRKCFDDFEDNYDKGKLRKYKPKRHYQSSKKQNYFQQYADRNYNRARYESYGYHNGKFFNSHNNRNRSNHHNSQNWKFSKNRYHS